MTYAASTVGYWVGQANDSSAGPHPTGWTSGQRWSETAEEWRVMQVNAVGAGTDNSTGRHPTGWTNGQLWSETAAEWMAMYDLEFANARDTSAGQTGSGLGAQHPTGWTNNQLWSETANEWNTMWGTEWRNARDPQGYNYSYPGQAPNAVYWSQSASYWRSQADYYWGPSRVWNNGGTWEGQAHYYWGPSRTWNNGNTWEYLTGYHGWISRAYNNGESWESAYYRVYTDRYNQGYADGGTAYRNTLNNPDSSPNYVAASLSGAFGNSDFVLILNGTLTIPKTGHWAVGVMGRAGFHAKQGGPGIYCTWRIGGSAGLSYAETFKPAPDCEHGGTDLQTGFGYYTHANLGAGGTVTVSTENWLYYGGSVTGTIFAHYIGTSTYGA